jgi:surfactin synthase thioesterase subunit
LNDEPELTGRVVFLLWASLLAMLSGLARQLSQKEKKHEALPLIGGLMGSAVAAFSFAALMIELFNVSNLLVLGMAGPIGWVGGDILAGLAQKYVNDAGIKTGSSPE